MSSHHALLRLPADQQWDTIATFMVLRAAHYFSVFAGCAELRINLPAPPPPVREAWVRALTRKKQPIRVLCGAEVPENAPLFIPGDYPALLDDGSRINFGIPEIPGLTDFHLHTRFAYCCENITVADALRLERLNHVRFINFAEHSGHLYANRGNYNRDFRWRQSSPAEDRTGEYLAFARAETAPGCTFGLELDVDSEYTVADLRDPALSGFRIGAIHFLDPSLPPAALRADYLRRLDALINAGIDIFAHAFRVFRRAGLPVPEDLFHPVAERLVRAGVAAEINFHTNFPPEEFILEVLRRGGKISFGTDSHNLYEAGYLTPHWEFCRRIGIAGRLDEVLLSAAAGRR